MVSRSTYRVWVRRDGGTWDRLSGGVQRSREEAIQYVNRDRLRREREGDPTLQYAVQECIKSVGPKEIV